MTKAKSDIEKEFRDSVYHCLFYYDKKWPDDAGPTIFFYGQRIHYSDFMKAKRGTL